MRTMCLLIFCLPAAWGESGLRGPVSGFALDARSHSIRPINGIPGAATLGQSLDIPFAIDRAVFSGRSDAAVVFGEGGVFLVRGMRQASPTIVPLPDAIADVTTTAFNASGGAAVFYSESRRQVQIVSGFSDEPVFGAPVDISRLPGRVNSAALDASATGVLLAMEESGTGAVYRLATDANGTPSFRLLLNAASPAMTLYLNGDRDALVADRSLNEIRLIRDLQGAAEVSMVANESDGISTPVGLQLSADEKTILVANAGSRTLTAHSLFREGPATSIDLLVTPSKLDRLNGGPVLVLNEIGGNPLFLLDEAGGRQVYFVPVN